MNKKPANSGVILLVLTALVFSGCNRQAPGGPGRGPAPQAAVFAVNTTAAVQGQIQDYIALSGDIVAGTQVDTYSDTAGKVAAVYVSVGDRVNRGARIAAIDPSRPGMDYQWSMVTAPIGGTVITLPAQVGMTISPAVPLARLVGGEALEIRLFVAERFISKMDLNLPCEVTLDAWPGEIFRGSVREISPTVDPASRTMEIKVNVQNSGSRLKAGMFAKVRIITERKDNIVKIPASAMLSRFGEQYVFVAEKNPEDPDQNIVRKRIVVPGILIDGVLEIQSGLAPDEEIVVRGQTQLDDGTRINIIERLTPLSPN